MRLSTADKVNAGFIIALAVVALIGVAAITSIQVFLNTSEEARRTHQSLTEVHSMLGVLSLAESSQRGYVITGDPGYLEPYFAAQQTLPARLNRLRDRVEEAAQVERIDLLIASVERRLQLMDDVVEVRRAEGEDAAAALVATGPGRGVMDRIRSIASEFESREFHRLMVHQSTAEARARFTTLIIAGGSLFTFMVVFGSAAVIRRDLVERRKAEKALRDSETLLSQFMENLPIGVMVVDSNWQPRFANNAAVDIIGARVLLDTGDRPLPLVQKDGSRYPDALTPVARALNGAHGTVDDAFVEVDGRRVPLEVSAAPVYDATGRIAYAIATFSDISGRRRSEEALRAAKDAAEMASRAKSEFLARMSHELRTPLNSVIGFANILLKNRSGNLRDQDIAYLDRIQENGKHLLLLINDILDLSKIEAGKVEVERQEVGLPGLIESVIRQWDGQLSGDVVMRSAIPDGLPTITTDANRLRQVLINLVGNAVKFTEKGEVRVTVDMDVVTRQPMRIRVRDTGIGIQPERLGAIFEAFEQAESSTSRRFGGTGLGLPISKALCELLGYRLQVHSTVGQGTEFTIEILPEAATDATRPRLATAPATARDGAERLVLIVDDEADSRILLTHYVEELGCRAIATHSGRSAITLARELRPDLITLDLTMPDVNGWELLTQLKADPQLSDIPVVIVSVIAQDSRASLLGALDVLQKPVARAELQRVLRRNVRTDQPRVLVVEDDADARELLLALLAEQQLAVRAVSNGREALDIVQSFEPELVITDLLMPEMDGMTFLELFRSTPRFQSVPVVVVTARDLDGADMDRLQRHTAAVLQKGNALDSDLRDVLGALLLACDEKSTEAAG